MPTLFAFESDPAWCAMAMVKPRSAAVFDAVWAKIFKDRAAGVTGLVPKVILADGEVCGTIGCWPLDGRHDVGYGLGLAYWGRGIASRALGPRKPSPRQIPCGDLSPPVPLDTKNLGPSE